MLVPWTLTVAPWIGAAVSLSQTKPVTFCVTAGAALLPPPPPPQPARTIIVEAPHSKTGASERRDIYNALSFLFLCRRFASASTDARVHYCSRSADRRSSLRYDRIIGGEKSRVRSSRSEGGTSPPTRAALINPFGARYRALKSSRILKRRDFGSGCTRGPRGRIAWACTRVTPPERPPPRMNRRSRNPDWMNSSTPWSPSQNRPPTRLREIS